MIVLLELFWSFVKIGFTSFGGTSMLPLINGEMLDHGWMTVSEVSDIVAIAEMSPGPLGLNCATFAGMRVAGVVGAVVASIGVLSPSFTLCLLAAVFFEHFKESRLMSQIMTGVRPACIGLIFGVMLAMALSTYVVDNDVSLAAVAVGLLDALLLIKFKLSVPLVIVLSAVLGLFCF